MSREDLWTICLGPPGHAKRSLGALGGFLGFAIAFLVVIAGGLATNPCWFPLSPLVSTALHWWIGWSLGARLDRIRASRRDDA
jgi:hypothetical protein